MKVSPQKILSEVKTSRAGSKSLAESCGCRFPPSGHDGGQQSPAGDQIMPCYLLSGCLMGGFRLISALFHPSYRKIRTLILLFSTSWFTLISLPSQSRPFTTAHLTGLVSHLRTLRHSMLNPAPAMVDYDNDFVQSFGV